MSLDHGGGRSTLQALARAGLRVHFHSDNTSFSGSEEAWCTMLVAFREAGGRVSASWRDSPQFNSAVLRRIGPEPRTAALTLPPGRSMTAWRRATGLVHGVFRRYQPDLLHVNNGGWPGATSALAALTYPEPTTRRLMVVNNLAYPHTGRRRLIASWEKSVARRADAFVTASTVAGQQLASVLGASARRIENIPNSGQEPAKTWAQHDARQALGLPADAFIAVCLGRYESRKGHRFLLEAWSRLADEQAVLLLCGEGPLEAEIRTGVQRLTDAGLDVRMLGQAADVWPVYASSDVVTLASTSNEDMPLTILEAMRAVRPVVVSQIGASGGLVIDHETGYVIPPANSELLAQALARLRDNSAEAARMAHAGRQRYDERFGPDRMISGYAELWRSLRPGDDNAAN